MRKQASPLSRKRKGVQNPLLEEQLIYTGEHNFPTQVNIIQFDSDKVKITELTDFSNINSYCDPNTINWIEVRGLSQVDAIQQLGLQLDLHRTDIQDLLTTQHIAKVECYNDNTLVLVNNYNYNSENQLQQEHIGVLLGRNYVVSFQDSPAKLFQNIYSAIEKNTSNLRNRGGDYLFCLLLNNIINQYVVAIGKIEDRLEEMENELMEMEINENLGKRIQTSRRDYILLKKSIFPLKEDFNILIRNDNKLIAPRHKVYLNDLNDRIVFVLQTLEVCRETLASLLDLYYSNNDLRMNAIMKRLTIISSIFIPLTFIVGVWGMNFEYMPELSHPYGYILAWVILILTGIATWWYIKRRKWY